MAYEILSESYGRRLPKIAAEADSADDLATLGTNWAEGSTCVIGDKTYSLDKVQGWVEPGSGGGSGGSGDIVVVNFEYDSSIGKYRADKTDSEIEALILDGKTVIGRSSDGVYTNYGRYFYSIFFSTGQATCEQLRPSETDYIYEATNATWAVTES